MLEPSLYRQKHTVLNVSCRVMTSQFVGDTIGKEFCVSVRNRGCV